VIDVRAAGKGLSVGCCLLRLAALSVAARWWPRFILVWPGRRGAGARSGSLLGATLCRSFQDRDRCCGVWSRNFRTNGGKFG